MQRQSRQGLSLIAAGAAALGTVVLASLTGCSTPPAVVAPAIAAATWSNSNGPTIYLTADAAQRGLPWCGAFLLTHQGQRPPCDPGVYVSPTLIDAQGLPVVTRTRWDVVSDDARGLSADDPAVARMVAECDDVGGEWIANLSPRPIDAPASDPDWTVAKGTCEGIDY